MNNVKYWIDHNFTNYIKKYGSQSVSIEDLDLILAWFNNKASERHIKRIYKISVQDALSMAKKWKFQELKKEHLKVIRVYPGSDIKWVQLTSLTSVKQEGYKMDNCLKSYTDINKKIYSLRDNGRSVVNIEFFENLVTQVKGFKNFEVPPQYREYVLDFLIKNPINQHHLVTSVLIDLGQIYINHSHYDLSSLPNSLNIKESINIVNNNVIQQIPDNWVINGNLLLVNCPNLKTIGRNLRVTGHILIQDCPQFEGFLDESLSVSSIELKKLPNLTILPKKINSHGSIIISDCKRLTDLPASIYSARDLILNNLDEVTRINNIQANEIKIQNCKNLSIIDFCSSTTNLIIANNESLNYLPSNLYIGSFLKSDRMINPKNKPRDYEHFFVGKGLLIKENDEWTKIDIVNPVINQERSNSFMTIIKSLLPFISLKESEKVKK